MVFEKIKNIFVGETEEEPEVREISLAELRGEISRRKNKGIKEVEKSSESFLEKASKIGNAIDRLSKNLAEAEPDKNLHTTVYKSANESKRLFLKKVKRASKYIESTPPPDWKKLIEFNRSLRHSVNVLENALISHGGGVATVFDTEVAQIEELTERLRSVSQNLNGALRRKKIQIEEFDDISSIISEREDLKKQEEELQEKKDTLKKHREEIEKNIEKDRESLKSLQKSQRFKELEELKREKKEIEERKKKIRGSIRSTVSRISRPMRKMKKMVQKGDHAIGRDAVEGLNLYFEDPFEAASSEEEGLPKFEALLHGLKDLMEEEMKLDERERRKRSKQVENLLEDKTLAKLRDQYEKEERKREKLEKEVENSSLLGRRKKLKESILKYEKDLRAAQSDLESTKEKLEEIRNQIKKKTSNLKDVLKSRLQVQVTNL